jgi:hypothetical protein
VEDWKMLKEVFPRGVLATWTAGPGGVVESL